MKCLKQALSTVGAFSPGDIGIRILRWRGGDRVDHPLADALEVKRLTQTLAREAPPQALEDTTYWLKSLNETPAFSAQRRYQLIDVLDNASRPAQARIAERYFELHEADFVEEKRIWKTMSAFWAALGDAYLMCVQQCDGNREFTQMLRDQLPQLAARGLRALRQQLKWAFLRYSAVDPELWQSCGRFAALAEAAGDPAQRLSLYAGNVGTSSPNDAFARLVMFWTAAPSSLAPRDQDIAERLVLYFSRRFRLLPRQEKRCDYYFDLDGQYPPMRIVRSSPSSPQTRYFDASEASLAAKSMHALASSSGYLPPGLDLGPAAEIPAVVRVLNQLMSHWGNQMPPRASQRKKTALSLGAVQGFQDVLNVFVPGKAEDLDFSEVLGGDAWLTNDVSKGGYGVIAPADKTEGLAVGNLVAMRHEADAAWQVGVIRRLSPQTNNRRHIGIELLSTTAVPVHLRTLSGVAQGGKRQWAILLNEQPTPDGSLYAVARRDLLNPREAIEATYGVQGKTTILEPVGLVESGHDFDRLHYRLQQSLL